MTEIACPICDWTYDLTDSAADAGLLSAMGAVPVGMSRESIEQAEKELVSHLEEHSLFDWVTAMRMADAYIEKVETDATNFAVQIDSLIRERDELRLQLAARPTPQYRPDGPPPPMPSGDFGAQWESMSPRQRQEQLAADREAGVIRTIPESLIPFINPANRPEGVVGRRR